MIYSRDTLWTTYLGKQVKVRHMDDSHVVNLTQFLKIYGKHPAAPGILPVLRQELEIRRLPEPHVTDQQVPYKDGSGNLQIWNFRGGGPEIVGKYRMSLFERFGSWRRNEWWLIKYNVRRWFRNLGKGLVKGFGGGPDDSLPPPTFFDDGW
jgi:hypothetical protein